MSFWMNPSRAEAGDGAPIADKRARKINALHKAIKKTPYPSKPDIFLDHDKGYWL
jgi:hypothetical protein